MRESILVLRVLSWRRRYVRLGDGRVATRVRSPDRVVSVPSRRERNAPALAGVARRPVLRPCGEHERVRRLYVESDDVVLITSTIDIGTCLTSEFGSPSGFGAERYRWEVRVPTM